MKARLIRRFVVLAALTALVAALWPESDERAPRASGELAAGVLSQSNSRDGSAVLTATNLGPGDSASGQVTIGNTGSLDGDFSLSKSNLADSAGPRGGQISETLRLRVEDLTTGQDVYQGGLADMPERSLGTFVPGESHTYRFTVAFPAAGAADNLYEGSSASASFDWHATGAAPATEPPARPPAETPRPSPASPPSRRRKRATKLALQLRVPGGQRLLRQGAAMVRVRCTKDCRFKATFRLRRPGVSGFMLFRSATRSLPGGRIVQLRVPYGPLTRAWLKRALRQRQVVRGVLTATASERNGKRTVQKSVAVRALPR